MASGKGCLVASLFTTLQNGTFGIGKRTRPGTRARAGIDSSASGSPTTIRCLSKKRPARPPPPALAYAALPDDNDAEQFDSNMVEMLATGKTMEKPLVGKKRKSSSSGSSSSSTGVGASMRTNPHTGAKEVFDADALFDDPSFFASALQTTDPTTNVQQMDVDESNGNGKTGHKTANGNRQDNDEVMDPVMAIASKLPAKKSANKNKDDSPEAKRAKKGKKGSSSVMETEEVDPVMAAAGKLFAKENSSSNGGS